MSIRTAVLGFGTAGRVFHAPLLDADPAFDLAAIVTRDPERRAAAAEAYPAARLLASPEEVFARADEFDLVVVGTPNSTHRPLALAALEHGLDVLLDKPIAVTATEADEVVAAAAAAGRTLAIFQNRRWDGDFLTLVDLLASGELGDVHQFESAFEWWKPDLGIRWKDTATPAEGGGILYDLGPHLIDQAIRLFGPVASVHAELDRRRPGAASDDDSFVALTHESGVRSRLWMSSVSPSNRARFRVVGSRAVATFMGLDPQEPQLIAGRRPGDAGFGSHDDGRAGLLASPDGSEREIPLRAGDYPEFYRRLAAALTDGSPLPVEPADSIAVLRLIEVAVEGAR